MKKQAKKPVAPTFSRREFRIVDIGAYVPSFGTVSAVLITGGERYYMLLDATGTVSLMPADVIEPAAWRAQRPKAHAEPGASTDRSNK